ncbi:hypothetical protein GCM10027341_09320 [Spirosoma knui]
MIAWIYRILLFVLLFGISPIAFGGNQTHALLDKVVNLAALVGMPALVLCYFRFPGLYKVVSWLLLLGVILLVLESKYEYNQYVYSYFVIKRFVYCGLAMSAFFVAARAEPFKLKYIVYLIFAFYFINQIVLGNIFSYNLTSESRTTSAFEALYLVIPFLYYLVNYLKAHKIVDLLIGLATFGFIVLLLHRSVITAAVGAAGIVVGLSMVGKLSSTSLPIGRTLLTLTVLALIIAPTFSLLPQRKMEAFLENIGGIVSPKEDETGSWRYEQSQFYLSLIPDRPVLGWRYAGYDRGEIMENEDFPEKGTIIHSQYIDMLYNYGAVGLGINLLIILGTLITIYRRNQTLTTEQVVLFGFITSGLVFAISYQLPPFFWGFVGLGMYYGLNPQANQVEPVETEDADELIYSLEPDGLYKHQAEV